MKDTTSAEQEKSPAPVKNSLSIDLRLIIVILLVVIAAMLAFWKPWSDTKTADRTITVTGEATLSAEPDEYTFYPTYEFNSANPDTALTELTDRSNGITDELKAIGVKDSQIKTNAGGYDYPVTRKPDSNLATYTLQFTIVIDDKELAQKVQDYLLTTGPSGSITPFPTFSDAQRKELESKARHEATKDALAKAEQSARNLGFDVGKVKEVTDSTGFGDYYSLGRGEALDSSQDSRELTIQPGQNDLSYAVTVTYYVD